MLTSFTVERFKSLVDLELPLGRVNLFIGANGSGKSNILEALGVLSAAASGRVDGESLTRRGVRPGTEQNYKCAFPGLSHVPHIRLAAATDKARFDVTLWNSPSDDAVGPPSWRFKTETLHSNGQKIVGRSPASQSPPNLNPEQGLAALEIVNLEKDDPALELMNRLRAYSIHDPNTPELRGAGNGMSTDPISLYGAGLPEAIESLGEPAPNKDEVLELIEWASDFEVETMRGVSPSSSELLFKDRFMADHRNRLTASDASEGALYVLFYWVLAMHRHAARCLAIDNFAQVLNPKLATKLTKAICAWTSDAGDRQWLLTAHNPAVLDGLPLQDPGVRLFTVDRSSNGHSIVRRLDLAAAVAKRPSEDWTLSRMWMNGLLGAVPNV